MVADNASITLRFFGREGRELASASGKGSGPGEVLYFEGLVSRADSLYAFDARGAVQLYTHSGRFVRRIRWSGSGGKRLFSERPDGVTLNSGLVGRLWRREMRTLTAGDPLTAELRRAREGSDSETSFGTHITAETFKTARDRYPRLVGYSSGLEVAVFPSEICYSTRERFLVQCVDTLGRSTRRIERTAPVRAVSRTMEAELRTAMSGRRRDGTSQYEGTLRTHRELMAQTVRVARTLPAIGRLVAATDGDLWISEYQAPTDGLPLSQGGGAPAYETRWTVVHPKGHTRAIAILPARFRLEDAGPGWVLGVATDDDDVERVEVLSIGAISNAPAAIHANREGR